MLTVVWETLLSLFRIPKNFAHTSQGTGCEKQNNSQNGCEKYLVTLSCTQWLH